jgi:hypothetical protein
MKNMHRFSIFLIFMFILSLGCISMSFAKPVFTRALLTNQATTATTSAFNTGMMKAKSVSFAGMSSASNVPFTLSGTAALECAPTSTGPWVACKDKGGTAVTTTNANAVFNLHDLFPYIRVVWTRTTQKLTAYLLYSED